MNQLNQPPRINVCGVAIDCLSFDEVMAAIVHHVTAGQTPAYVVTPNAQHVVMWHENDLFRQIYQQAWLVVPDGVPLLWAARWFGTPLRGRVNGTDSFEQLCAISAEKGFRVFLMGGRSGAAAQAAQVLQARHPQLQIAGTDCPKFGFESDPVELERMAAAVRTAAPDILFVGLGAPKQEYWIYQNYQALGVPVMLGIGGSFEMVGGVVKRAPLWMQRLGLEWLFRLLSEPQRMWRRYLVGNVAFVRLVLRQRLSHSGY
jgi:N-acetylglucosaminyldiphosphoundecaprenol N-acetyl-beta-D-mannosaminyltransferase